MDLVKLFNDSTLINTCDEYIRAKACVRDKYVRENLNVGLLNYLYELSNHTNPN